MQILRSRPFHRHFSRRALPSPLNGVILQNNLAAHDEILIFLTILETWATCPAAQDDDGGEACL